MLDYHEAVGANLSQVLRAEHTVSTTAARHLYLSSDGSLRRPFPLEVRFADLRCVLICRRIA